MAAKVDPFKACFNDVKSLNLRYLQDTEKILILHQISGSDSVLRAN